MLTPIQKNRVFEDVAAQIRKQIEEGVWKEGEKIQGEMELARQFQVSRGSVREAIKSLQTLGILEAYSGQGTFVAKNALQKIKDSKLSELINDESRYDDILECRYVIETHAAMMAAVNCTEKDIAYLTQTYEQMMAYTEQGEIHKYNECGNQFHTYIVGFLKNELLEAFYETILPRLYEERASFSTRKSEEDILKAHNEHKMLIEAFKAHDPERARLIMSHHLGEKITSQSWQKLLAKEAPLY